MGKIPTFGGSDRVSTQVALTPTESSKGARLIGRATAGAVQAGTKLAQGLIEKRQQSRDKDYINNSRRQHKMASLEEQKLDASEHQQSGDWDGYAKKGKESRDIRTQELLNDAPSNFAREQLQKSLGNMNDSLSIGADAEENKNKAFMSIRQDTEGISQMSSHYFNNTNPSEAALDMEFWKNDIEGNVGIKYDRRQADALIKQVDGIGLSTVRGMLKNDMEGLIDDSMTPDQQRAQVDNFLSGKMAGTEGLFKGISPSQTETFRRTADAQIRRRESEMVAKMRNTVNQASNVMLSGSVTSPEMQRQISAVEAELNAMPNTEDTVKLKEHFAMAREVSTFTEGISSHSSTEMAKIFSDISNEKISGDLESASTSLKGREMMKRAIASDMRERNEDGAAYIDKHFGAMSAPERLAKQESLGIANPRVLTKGEAAQAGSAIREGLTEGDGIQYVEGLLHKYSQDGEDLSAQAFLEISKADKSIDESIKFLPSMDSSESRKTFMETMIRKKGIVEAFKSDPLASTNSASIRMEINGNSDMTNLKQLAMQSGDENLYNAYHEPIVTRAKQLMLKGVSAKDATQSATSEIMDSNFSFYNDGSNPIIIPKKFGVTNDQVGDFIDNSKDPARLKSLGVTSAREGNWRGTEEEYIDFMTNRAFWKSSEDGNGMDLWQTASDGRTRRVRRKDGQNINVPFNRLKQLDVAFTQAEDIQAKQRNTQTLQDLANSPELGGQ